MIQWYSSKKDNFTTNDYFNILFIVYINIYNNGDKNKEIRISILFFSMKLNLYIIEQNINVIIYICMYMTYLINCL